MILFDTPGKGNTQTVIEIAVAEARKRNIHQIVIASSTGYVAELFLRYAQEFTVVVVGYCYYVKPGMPNLMNVETQEKLRQGGINLLFGTHVLSGAEHQLRTKFGGTYPVDLMAHTLTMFGAGVKVGIECTVAALDAGLIVPEPTIGIGGSGCGSDAAVILTPDSSIRFLNTKIHDILCKPSFYEEMVKE
ncbi:MAG: pyruvate kinase alpha/beta domain-containing protein [Christensenellaceae bacterium]|jgi:hypothetical protein